VNFSKADAVAGAGREGWHSTLQLAVEEVFDLMLGSVLEGPPQPPAGEGLEITAMVGMAGQLCGVLSVCCSTRTAVRMASRMLGIEPEKCGSELWDALAEISNMVAGNFKNKIAGLGDGCMLSVPTVIRGEDYHLRSLGNEQIRVELRFQAEPLVVTLDIHN
jgi:chemotaxis protein CheX